MMFGDMPLREACNKIIHATTVEPHNREGSEMHRFDEHNEIGWYQAQQDIEDDSMERPERIRWKHLSFLIRLGGHKHNKEWWHLLEIPAMALERIRLEIGHMGEITNNMLRLLGSAFSDRDLEKFQAVRTMDDKVDILQGAILNYMGRLRREPLTEKQSQEFQALMSATINLENLADVIESELVAIGEAFIAKDIKPSEATGILLYDLKEKLVSAINDLITAVRKGDERAAENVITLGHEVRRLADEFIARQSERIAGREGPQADLIRLEMELLDKMRRIYTLAKRVAKEFVPEVVAGKTD
jgi:phosphate:Na+ symporter